MYIVTGKISALSLVAHAECDTRSPRNRRYISCGRERARTSVAFAVRSSRRQGSRVLQPHPFVTRSPPPSDRIIFFPPVSPSRPVYIYGHGARPEIPANPEIRRCMPCAMYLRRFAATRSGSLLFVRVYRILRAFSVTHNRPITVIEISLGTFEVAQGGGGSSQ